MKFVILRVLTIGVLFNALLALAGLKWQQQTVLGTIVMWVCLAYEYKLSEARK